MNYINEYGEIYTVIGQTMDHVEIQGGPNGSFHLHKKEFYERFKKH